MRKRLSLRQLWQQLANEFGTGTNGSPYMCNAILLYRSKGLIGDQTESLAIRAIKKVMPPAHLGAWDHCAMYATVAPGDIDEKRRDFCQKQADLLGRRRKARAYKNIGLT